MSIVTKLDVRPRGTDSYLWCDYVEMLCLTDPDWRYSRGDLLELLAETRELAAEDPDLLGGDDEDLEDEADLEEALDEEDRDFLAEDEAERIVHSVDDKREARVADIFNNLRFRAHLFGEAYPFSFDEEAQEMLAAPLDSDEKKLYVQLLLSSSLRLIPKTRRHEVTEPFEALAEKIFACLMPDGWQVHRFGAKVADRYKGRLFKRLKQLAADLRGQLLVEERAFKTRDSGDGGLDLVAWHPMGDDEREGIPIALAQCGCTAEEWSLKMLEASPASLGTNLATLHPWATYYFMPQDLYDSAGGRQAWQRRRALREAIVIDRARVIRLAKRYGVSGACVTAPAQVEEVMQLRHAA
jgi:hypothetical protein